VPQQAVPQYAPPFGQELVKGFAAKGQQGHALVEHIFQYL
jgi:hypothetical protein